jgi:hypothetical protein
MNLHTVIVLAIALAPSAARADRYEAQWIARPFAGVAALEDEGATAQPAMTAGLSIGFSYGVSNRLDIGAELMTLTTTTPRLTETTVVDGGAPYHGPFTRRASSALLMLGPTWRYGVSWVPVVSLAVGGGIRYRSAGRFTDIDLIPNNKHATTALDLAATLRVGMEHRVNRRWTVGAYLSALANWGPAVPVLPLASLSCGVSYVHYPAW